jgi:hypothetical protein
MAPRPLADPLGPASAGPSQRLRGQHGAGRGGRLVRQRSRHLVRARARAAAHGAAPRAARQGPPTPEGLDNHLHRRPCGRMGSVSHMVTVAFVWAPTGRAAAGEPQRGGARRRAGEPSQDPWTMLADQQASRLSGPPCEAPGHPRRSSLAGHRDVRRILHGPSPPAGGG